MSPPAVVATIASLLSVVLGALPNLVDLADLMHATATHFICLTIIAGFVLIWAMFDRLVPKAVAPRGPSAAADKPTVSGRLVTICRKATIHEPAERVSKEYIDLELQRIIFCVHELDEEDPFRLVGEEVPDLIQKWVTDHAEKAKKSPGLCLSDLRKKMLPSRYEREEIDVIVRVLGMRLPVPNNIDECVRSAGVIAAKDSPSGVPYLLTLAECPGCNGDKATPRQLRELKGK